MVGLQELRDYLKMIKAKHREKEESVMKMINSLQTQEKIKPYIVTTNELGQNMKVYSVHTNLALGDFLYIDYKYGGKTRTQSTSINDMKRGAKAEGYVFDIIMELPIENGKQADYSCRVGNY